MVRSNHPLGLNRGKFVRAGVSGDAYHADIQIRRNLPVVLARRRLCWSDLRFKGAAKNPHKRDGAVCGGADLLLVARLNRRRERRRLMKEPRMLRYAALPLTVRNHEGARQLSPRTAPTL